MSDKITSTEVVPLLDKILNQTALPFKPLTKEMDLDDARVNKILDNYPSMV
jgi:hypothetical protein